MSHDRSDTDTRTETHGAPQGFFAVGPGDGRQIWFRGSFMTVKAGGTDTHGAVTIMEQRVGPGFEAAPHVHHADDEPWYVLEGSVLFHCGGQSYLAQPGAFLFLPRGIEHSFKVMGDQPATLLLMSVPGGIDEYFTAAGRPALKPELPSVEEAPQKLSAQQWEQMIQLAARYHIELRPRGTGAGPVQRPGSSL